MTSVDLLIANIGSKRVRNGLLVISVAISIAVLTVSLSVAGRMHALQSGNTDHDRLFVTADGPDPQLSILNALRAIPGVTKLSWFRAVKGIYDERTAYQIRACNDTYPAMSPREWLDIPPDVIARWQKDPQGLIAGAQVAELFKWKAGDSVVLNTKAGQVPVRVIGIADGILSMQAMMHFEYLAELTKNYGLTVVLLTAPAGQAGATSELIESTFASSSSSLRATLYDAEMAGHAEAMSSIPSLLARVGLLIFLTTVGVAVSMFVMSLRERLSEFATLWAIGFPRRYVVGLLLVESVAICFAGGAIGAIIPFLVLHNQGMSLGISVLNNVTVSPATCLLGMAISIGIGVLVALLPSLRAIGGLSVRDLAGD